MDKHSVTQYRQYAADCMTQAQAEESADDRTIVLNVALAWLRLAEQTEALAAAGGGLVEAAALDAAEAAN